MVNLSCCGYYLGSSVYVHPHQGATQTKLMGVKHLAQFLNSHRVSQDPKCGDDTDKPVIEAVRVKKELE